MSVIGNHVDVFMLDESLSPDMRKRAGIMQQEMRRANNQLVQVLTLYKLDNQRLVPNIRENNVYDFLEELWVEEKELAEAQHVQISIDCDEWLAGYFDVDLVRGVLSSSIGNAKRYTRDQVLLSAEQLDGYLVIRVEDNGQGFPQSFLEYRHDQTNEDFGRAFSEGRTQLGFFFAANIARAHQNRGRQGYIRLKNGHSLQGGCFELWLP
jgi:signal transduction histidine kinase